MPFEPSDSRKKVAIGLIGEELTKSRIRNSISSTSYPNRSSFFGMEILILLGNGGMKGLGTIWQLSILLVTAIIGASAGSKTPSSLYSL